MIRWKGFLPLFLFTGLLSISYLLYANILAEDTVELLGWEINRASVDLGRAKISLSPLGFDMRQLEVANAKDPERNVLQVGKISFKMDFNQLLHLNWVINEMHVEEIQFDTKRRHRARVAKSAKAETAKSTQPTTSSPGDNKKDESGFQQDIGNLLKKENLQSLKLAEDLQTRSSRLNENWKTAKQKLPTQNKLDEYKKRVKKLDIEKAKDAIKHRKEIRAIRDEIKADIRALSTSQKNISRDVKGIDKDFKSIKQAYRNDVNRLKKKYAFNQQGMENYAKLFFGNSTNKWLHEGLYWYDKLKPYLSNAKSEPEDPPVDRWKGTDIAFYDRQPTPRFLLKSAKLSIRTDMGQIGGQLLDVSSDQHKTRRPAKLLLHSTDLNRAKSLNTEAVFDFTQAVGNTSVKTQVLQWRIQDWSISKDDKFPLKLQKAQVDFIIDANIVDDKLQGGFQAKFNGAKFSTRSDGKGLTGVINRAFANIQQFTLYGKLKGSIKHPGLSLKSDLDSVIKDALGEEVKKMTHAYEKKVEQKLESKLQEKLGNSEQNLKDIKSMGSDIGKLKEQKENYLAQLEQKLKHKKNQKIQNERDKLKNKLKKKLF